MESKRYCPFCGEGLPLDAKFCAKCGSVLAPKNQAEIQPKVVAEAPQTIVAQTQQPVSEQVKYADGGERFIAFIIDSIIINVMLQIGMMIFSTNILENKILTLAFNFVYHFAGEMANNGFGQTFGKKIMKLRTVDMATGGNINPTQAMIHIIGKVAFLPIDVILGLIAKDQEKGQPNREEIRIMQRVAKTAVIKA
jgi:uncharacterized RDD family membrane protein YckC